MGGSQQSFKLNRDKTKESVFSARCKVALPPLRPDIERVSSLRVLGVILNDKLTAADHVTALLSSGSSMLYAMRVLRSHGTPTTSLQDNSHLAHPVRGTIVVWHVFSRRPRTS